METTTKVNGKTVTWSLAPRETPDKVAADLISRGFDGQYYMGESRPVGRQKQRIALFVRGANGFEYAL